MIEAVYAVVAFTVGFAVAWLIRRTRDLPERVRLETQLSEARKSLEEQKKLLDEAQVRHTQVKGGDRRSRR